MGVVHIRVEVCDVCRIEGKAVEHFKVGMPGGRLRTFALCKEDSAALVQLNQAVAESTPVAQRRVRHEFTDMNAVEAARKTAPAKKTTARKK